MTRSFLKSLTAFAFAVLIVFGTTVSVTAQTTFYSDQATFEAANPALDVEDFSGSVAEPGGVCSGPWPLDSGTSDGCFDSGILAGLEFEGIGASV